MSGDASPLRCVLDVETAPRAHALDGRPEARHAAKPSPHDQELTCAGLLLVGGDGRDAARIRLVSVDARPDDGQLVATVDALLPDASRADATLITFNGVRHDLVALRSRALARWAFATPRLRRWCAGEGRHRDLMLELSAGGEATWPSLAAACGALGVPAKQLPVRSRRSPEAVALNNQCDVVATYLLHLHLTAFEAGDPLLLAERWLALADALGGEGAPEHLLAYTTHPRLAAARQLAAGNRTRSRAA